MALAVPLRAMKVLVTGACGFSGRYLVRKLLEQGHTVRAADVVVPRAGVVDPELVVDPRAEFVVTDVTDAAACRRAVDGCDAVFHVGALVPYNLARSFSREEVMRVNVTGTSILVAAAVAAGVRAFVLASSTGVVFQGDDIAGGTEALNAKGPQWNDGYSESKARAEAVVLSVSNSAPGGMACVALRPNGIMGPAEAHHTPKLLFAAQCGGAPIMGGSALTDFTHRDNLAFAFIRAMELLLNPKTRASVAGRAYFVTDGWPVHTVEYFSPLLQELGFAAPYPSLIVPRGLLGYKTDQRISRAQFAAVQQALASTSPASSTPITPSSNAAAKPAKAKRGRSRSASAAPSSGSLGGGTADATADEIILTTDPVVTLPNFLLYLTGFILEMLALLLRPIRNIEPFLTVGDVRKVVKHNYYRSDAAVTDLGYTPQRTVASGIKEMVAYYKAAGWDGRVRSPGLVPWLLAPPGVALTGLLAYDVAGMFHACFSAVQPFVNVAHVSAVAHACKLVYSWIAGTTVAELRSTTDEDAVRGAVAAIFWGATLCHVLQGMWGFRLAMVKRLNAAGYGIQGFFLGFASTRLLVQHAGLPNAHLVPPICISLFVACIPAVVAIHAHLM